MMRYDIQESEVTELKLEIPTKNQIVKTAIAFCNTHGGRLIIGVADNQVITGLTDDEVEKAMEYIDQSIFDSCSPPILPKLYTQRVDDKIVLIVEITEGMNKPYYQRSKGIKEGVYVRLGRHTMRANPETIQELQWQSRGIDYERLPVFHSTIEDLDQKAIQDFAVNRKNHGEGVVDEALMRSYNIISYEQGRKYPSVLGILLFGKNPQQFFSEAMIICSHFKGNEGREAIATVDCEGNLFNQFKQAYNFIVDRLHRSFAIKDLKREEQLEIPKIAIREALLNMIVHRNYHIPGPSKVAIYSDRIEFFSPGQFPGLISTTNLRAGITVLRNPAICKVLREANYIEKLGSGFITIFDSYKKANLKDPLVVNGENYVKCILPRAPKGESAGNQDETQILAILQSRKEVNIGDVAKHLSLSKQTARRKLQAMIDNGVVERVGKARNTYYRLNR